MADAASIAPDLFSIPITPQAARAPFQVKRLVWEHHPAYGQWYARSHVGTYVVDGTAWRLDVAGGPLRECGTFFAAKLAAQRDFETRVKSMIEGAAHG